ncbi:2-dehydro-3-deoxy-D-gluconate 5-dehydrogenase KduD [Parafilimonas sp.]|uniref:2-dehydro-3-deoxy-D-gluconate 5-dehydrogenase KduD n=1 Tax=Parafilimonas sp. TaxID=1969739 RepID=UPI0039E22A47
MSLQSLFDLSGKTALVTGCDKGIGKAYAIALAEAGADIIGASRSLENGSSIEKEVTALGKIFRPYKVDLEDRASVYAFIEKVKAENKAIDILVNNAGTIMRKPAAEHPDAYWDKVIDINLNAQFILTREFGKDMIEKGSGKIVFTCSMLSYQGGITVPGYTASKSAIAGLVKAFANEWAGKGININGIAPGYIATDNTQALREDAARNKSILERIPASRWGTPDDLKGAIIYLCSPASDYVNGTILNVDGGWMAR